MCRYESVVAHFRLRPRFPIELRVTVRRQHERSAREVDARTVNIGHGGAFIVLDPPLPVGTKVSVSIVSATTWEPLRLLATVRWVRDVAKGIKSGMGVMFDGMAPDQVIALQRLFSTHGYELD